MIGSGRDQKIMQNAYKNEYAALGEVPQLTTPSLSWTRVACTVLGISPDVIIRLQFPFFFFFFIYSRPSSGLWLTNRKAFERFSKVLITLP